MNYPVEWANSVIVSYLALMRLSLFILLGFCNLQAWPRVRRFVASLSSLWVSCDPKSVCLRFATYRVTGENFVP